MGIDIEKYKRKAKYLEVKTIRWLKSITLPGFRGKPFYDVLVYFINGFSKGYLTDRAAAVAFNVFLAIFPAVMVLFTFIPYLPLEGVQAMIVDMIYKMVPQNIAGRVVDTIEEIMSLYGVLLQLWRHPRIFPRLRHGRKPYRKNVIGEDVWRRIAYDSDSWHSAHHFYRAYHHRKRRFTLVFQ